MKNRSVRKRMVELPHVSKLIDGKKGLTKKNKRSRNMEEIVDAIGGILPNENEEAIESAKRFLNLLSEEVAELNKK